MAKPTVSRPHESRLVRFHGLAAGGDAVGRTLNLENGEADGKTVFAPFAAPGDVARVALLEDRKNFSRGQLVSVEQPSPLRVPPPCPYYRPEKPAHSCGGCQIQHLNYDSQLDVKRQLVRDALERIGGLRGVEVQPCVPSPLPWRYRNKADFVVGVERGKPVVGFFARESHDLIDIEDCPLQCEENNAILHAAREILAANPDWAFDPRRGRGDLRRLVARTAGNGESLVTLVTNRPKWLFAGEFARLLREKVPHLVGVLQRGPREDVFTASRTVAGRDWLEESVNGLDLRVHGEAFFQVNRALTPGLGSTAVEMAEVQSGQRALDIYCGAGLFALTLARRGVRVTGVEAHQGAVVDARNNAERLGLSASFVVGDAGREIDRFAPGEFNLVLLDPPRAGAAECVPGLLRLSPERIVYVSCDPATLARDVKALVQAGYELRRAVPLDMFPQTSHVETVVLLQHR
jgi:23S rRNA (uracil1939-C5)-methyltransferase